MGCARLALMSPMQIQFIPGSELVELTTKPPQPAKKLIPEWYKNIPTYHYKNPEFNSIGQITNKNVKSCMPFFDALTSGYILSTWSDCFIKRLDNRIEYFYSEKPELLKIRENSSVVMNDSFDPIEFIWKLHWGFKLPKGYSMLVTHPFNRYDLPFVTLTGIMDTDTFDVITEQGGNIPFYLKKDFEGLIPAGTPIMQFIPIKRDSWLSKIENFDSKKTIKKTSEFGQKFMNYYKDFHWKRKEYN
jgi:hypothetical protein